MTSLFNLNWIPNQISKPSHFKGFLNDSGAVWYLLLNNNFQYLNNNNISYTYFYNT